MVDELQVALEEIERLKDRVEMLEREMNARDVLYGPSPSLEPQHQTPDPLVRDMLKELKGERLIQKHETAELDKALGGPRHICAKAPMDEEHRDYVSHLEGVAAAAGSEAYARALSSGVPVTVVEDGWVVRHYGNGCKEFIKRISSDPLDRISDDLKKLGDKLEAVEQGLNESEDAYFNAVIRGGR